MIQSIPDALHILGSRTNKATVFEKIQLVFSSLVFSTRTDHVKRNFPEITFKLKDWIQNVMEAIYRRGKQKQR